MISIHFRARKWSGCYLVALLIVSLPTLASSAPDVDPNNPPLNVVNMMQSSVGLMSTLAGFCATILALLIQRVGSLEKESPLRQGSKEAIFAFLLAFLINFFGAYLAAIGTGETIGETVESHSRAYALYIGPAWFLCLSLTFMFIGLVLMLECYGLDYGAPLYRILTICTVFIMLVEFSGTIDDAFNIQSDDPHEFRLKVFAVTLGAFSGLVAQILNRRTAVEFPRARFLHFSGFCVGVTIALYVLLIYVNDRPMNWTLPVPVGYIVLGLASVVLGWSTVFSYYRAPVIGPTPSSIRRSG